MCLLPVSEPVCFGRYRDTRNVSLKSKINRKLRKCKHVFHFGRYYQLSIELKRKLDGKSIANFVNKNTIFPHKITYLTCHSSAIYTCKVTCLPCMLLNCLFLLPHINYALNYILFVFVCLFEIRNCIFPAGSTPKGGPTEITPTTQATRHPRASSDFLFPRPPPPPPPRTFVMHPASGPCPPLSYTCSSCWQVLFRNGAAQAVFHSTRRNAIPTSGFAPIVFWRIWALETIVNNLKSVANFGNLNVFFLYQWNLLGGRLLVKCVLGWIGGGRISPVIIW